MMPSAYEGLELELIEFPIEDVITSSTDAKNDVMAPEICIDNN
jgi:hypothetical protein